MGFHHFMCPILARQYVATVFDLLEVEVSES